MDRLEVPRTEPTAIEGSVQDGKSKGMQVVIRDDLKPPSGGRNPKGSKLKGQMRDSPEVRLSKTLSWILRHGAKSEGLAMRPDGYIRVIDLLANSRLQGVGFPALQEIVTKDAKKRYDLLYDAQDNTPSPTEGKNGIWWMRANQGHTIRSVQLELQPILSSADIAMAVHGTTLRAWQSISTQGLSKMTRNHIHLAQGLAGEGVISGMRNSSQILVYIDVEKAISAGIKFFLSANGVVLTEGDERGYLAPQFFSRVENAKRVTLPGWEGQANTVQL